FSSRSRTGNWHLFMVPRVSSSSSVGGREPHIKAIISPWNMGVRLGRNFGGTHLSHTTVDSCSDPLACLSSVTFPIVSVGEHLQMSSYLEAPGVAVYDRTTRVAFDSSFQQTIV